MNEYVIGTCVNEMNLRRKSQKPYTNIKNFWWLNYRWELGMSDLLEIR